MRRSAFRLRPKKPLARELARVMEAQLTRARTLLGEWAVEPERAVHETRRRLKKIRTAARVAREIDAAAARAVNAAARDAGRALSTTRDADVVRAAAEALAKDCPDEAVAATLRRFARAAAREVPADEDRGAQVAQALAKLAGADRSVARLGKAKTTGSALSRAAKRAFARADAAFAATAPGRGVSAEELEDARHEWRKRVKDVWHLGRLMRDVWPLKRPASVDLANELGKTLGTERDLLLLEARLKRSAKVCGGAVPRDAALAYVVAERGRVAAHAMLLGAKLHRSKSRTKKKKAKTRAE